MRTAEPEEDKEDTDIEEAKEYKARRIFKGDRIEDNDDDEDDDGDEYTSQRGASPASDDERLNITAAARASGMNKQEEDKLKSEITESVVEHAFAEEQKLLEEDTAILCAKTLRGLDVPSFGK